MHEYVEMKRIKPRQVGMKRGKNSFGVSVLRGCPGFGIVAVIEKTTEPTGYEMVVSFLSASPKPANPELLKKWMRGGVAKTDELGIANVRFWSPKVYMHLHRLALLRQIPVLTTNILNRGSVVQIELGAYGTCTDPGTETYHCM